MATAENWRLLDQIAVRAAGFPMELLDALRTPEPVADVRAVLAADADLAARSDRLRDGLAAAVDARRRAGDRASVREVSRALRRVLAQQPVAAQTLAVLPAQLHAPTSDWNRQLARRDELVAAARDRFDAHLERCRRALRAAAARPDVQEALFLLSPAVFDGARRYLEAPVTAARTARTREIERRLVSYLQRLVAKNETNSFFGAVDYGTIDATAPAALRIRRDPRRITARHVLPAHWMVETLARGVGCEPSARPWLRPRRTAGSAVHEPAGTVHDLAGTVHDLADGRRRVTEIAAELGVGWPQVWAAVDALAARGAVDPGPLVPPDLADPLAWLIAWTAALPDDCPARRRWLPRLEELAGLLAAFAVADLGERQRLLARIEDRFADACGRPGRRLGGQMYADRGLLFEECRGDLAEVVVGGRLAADLVTRLQPILRLAEAHGILRWRRDQREATAVWRRLAGPDGATPVPVPRYLRALAADGHRSPAPTPSGSTPPAPTPPAPTPPAPVDDELARFESALRDLVRARSDGRVAALRSADLPRPALPDVPDTLSLTSLDIMISATGEDALAAGDYQLVVGEMHPQPLLWAFPTGHFLDDERRTALRQGLESAIAAQPGAGVAAHIAHTRSSKVFPYPLPGHPLELRTRLTAADATPVGSVQVRRRDDGVCWWQPQLGWLRLYPPLRRGRGRLDPVSPFAFPAVTLPTVDLGEHTPRIEVDQIVLQRRRWKLPADGFGQRRTRQADDFGHFLAVWRAKERYGLPDRMYVRVAHETKPFFVDFADILLVEMLESLARASDVLVCTEALPGPDQLWLHGPRGRHGCEFRTIAWTVPG